MRGVPDHLGAGMFEHRLLAGGDRDPVNRVLVLDVDTQSRDRLAQLLRYDGYELRGLLTEDIRR